MHSRTSFLRKRILPQRIVLHFCFVGNSMYTLVVPNALAGVRHTGALSPTLFSASARWKKNVPIWEKEVKKST
jgi:hypothetical protein